MKVGAYDDQGLALLSQSALRQCYALMAGKLVPPAMSPYTNGTRHLWEGLGERHNPKAEQSE